MVCGPPPRMHEDEHAALAGTPAARGLVCGPPPRRDGAPTSASRLLRPPPSGAGDPRVSPRLLLLLHQLSQLRRLFLQLGLQGRDCSVVPAPVAFRPGRAWRRGRPLRAGRLRRAAAHLVKCPVSIPAERPDRWPNLVGEPECFRGHFDLLQMRHAQCPLHCEGGLEYREPLLEVPRRDRRALTVLPTASPRSRTSGRFRLRLKV